MTLRGENLIGADAGSSPGAGQGSMGVRWGTRNPG